MKSISILIITLSVISINLSAQTQSEFVVSEDLIFGRDALPENGVAIADTFLFFDKGKGAFRIGTTFNFSLFESTESWSPENVGQFSFATGLGTVASGYGSIAMGDGSIAKGSYSTAMGVFAIADEYASVAMGSLTRVNGDNSTAMGSSTIANGSSSTAMGRSTHSNGYASTVIGMYNDSLVTRQTSASSLTPLFIVGNGNAHNDRSNAMVVRKDGNVGIGNVNPSRHLHILGDATIAQVLVAPAEDQSGGDSELLMAEDDNGTYGIKLLYNGEDNDLRFIERNVNDGDILMEINRDGPVNIPGALSKGSGTFKIDHPLDPLNKYLYHSFVESPDMMNVYNGNVILDANGEAVVEMADWFSALNMEYRYQLTCIGGFAQVYIAEEISDNHFKIAGGSPGLKVSWQVTGIRKDPYAQMNRVQVEEIKPVAEQGTYLHPKAYRQTSSSAAHHNYENE